MSLTGPTQPGDADTPPADQRADDEKWPIGFMTILLLVTLYLGWRLVQAVAWVIDKI